MPSWVHILLCIVGLKWYTNINDCMQRCGRHPWILCHACSNLKSNTSIAFTSKNLWRKLLLVSAWGTHSFSTIGWITAGKMFTYHIAVAFLLDKECHGQRQTALNIFFHTWKGHHPRKCNLTQETISKMQLCSSPPVNHWQSLFCWMNMTSQRAMRCVKVFMMYGRTNEDIAYLHGKVFIFDSYKTIQNNIIFTCYLMKVDVEHLEGHVLPDSHNKIHKLLAYTII